MKSIYLGLALMAAAGCSDDSALSSQGVPQNEVLSGRNAEEILPANALNPYDSAGAVHNLVVLSYYASDWTGNSQGVGKRIDLIAGNSPEFGALDGAPYAMADSVRIESINSAADPLAMVLQDSGMSAAADSSLSVFLYGFFGNYSDSTGYGQVYESIADYEDAVLSDAALSQGDKKIILTATSVMRHAAYLEKKKPKKNEDPDWLLLIGSVAAAVDGAQQGTGQAVAMAAASGVLYNFK